MNEILKYIQDCESDDTIDEVYAIELIVYSDNRVWEDSHLDEHRWYSLREVVVEYQGKYIKYWEYITTGDNSMRDMDLEYDLDDFKFVEKKVKTVEVTYYE